MQQGPEKPAETCKHVMSVLVLDALQFLFLHQESELLVTNLGDKLLQPHEVLTDLGSLRLLANLHESLVSIKTTVEIVFFQSSQEKVSIKW